MPKDDKDRLPNLIGIGLGQVTHSAGLDLCQLFARGQRAEERRTMAASISRG
jgi:hypothetical protein